MSRIGLISALASIALFSSLAWGQEYTASNGKSQQMGSAGGYDYELWSQDGAGSAKMTLTPSATTGGSFTCEWQGTINMLARAGKRWGSNSTTTVQNVGNITAEFDVEWSSTDDVKYVSVYGWGYYEQKDIPSGFTNEIEYYIIQDRGSYDPTSQGGSYKGSATIDGIEYDFYTTDRRNQPSLSGTSTFKQYWSKPKNTSQHRTSGTISISKHFEEWAKVGMPMGRLYEVASMKIESYTGSAGRANGRATVKKNILTIGGEPAPQPTPSSSSSGGSSGDGGGNTPSSSSTGGGNIPVGPSECKDAGTFEPVPTDPNTCVKYEERCFTCNVWDSSADYWCGQSDGWFFNTTGLADNIGTRNESYWYTEVTCPAVGGGDGGGGAVDPSSSSAGGSTPAYAVPQIKGSVQTTVFDLRGNVVGLSATLKDLAPGVYLVRTGSQTKTVIVK
jgi:hypothetical protein